MTKKEMELKIEGMEKDLKTAYEVIKTQHKETENIHLEYKSLVSQKEYDTLLKRYGKLGLPPTKRRKTTLRIFL